MSERTFELVGGALPMDLANTVGGDRTVRPTEYLPTYGDLVSFGRQAGVLSEREAARLRALASERPALARAALARAIDLRESIHRAFEAVRSGRRPPAEDVEAIHAAALHAFAASKLVPGKGYEWREPADLDRVRDAAARDALALLEDPPLIGRCAGEACGWLYVDRTKNHSRRWCSMADCGNRAKARRHYRRAKRARA
ncbi:MAG TPA: CGNR zinc finger domain-containing protein [Candidatus Limnocylindria bacterium]|nr:CGNR zinc finger domain-containing protein [Candidatus Limnocylindria bacterium]